MSGYNISPGLLAAAKKRGVLPPDSGGTIFDRSAKLWSRVNVPVAGQTEFTFFNEPQATGVTNVNQGQLQANQVFIARGLRLSFLCGFDRTGLRLGIASPTTAQRNASTLNQSSFLAAATTNDAITGRIARWAEKSRELLQQGTVRMNIGEREVFNIYGGDSFPSGKGVTADFSAANPFATTATTTSVQLEHLTANISNGEKVLANRYNFTRPVGIFAGQTFFVGYSFPRAVDFTEADIGPLASVSGAVTAGVLMAELEGELITPVQ